MKPLLHSHSSSEVDALPLLSTEPPHALSNKGRRILSLYIQLYQVVDVGEVSETALMQIRGCGQRTAAEISHWLRNVSARNTSPRALCQLMTGPERCNHVRP